MVSFEEKFALIAEKMRKENLPEIAIKNFEFYYRTLLEGHTGFIGHHCPAGHSEQGTASVDEQLFHPKKFAKSSGKVSRVERKYSVGFRAAQGTQNCSIGSFSH